MKFWKFVDEQERARHGLIEALLNEIAALQKEYDKLLEKFTLLTAEKMQKEEKALVVVNPVGFKLGGNDEAL